MYNRIPFPHGREFMIPGAYGQLGQWAWVLMVYRTVVAFLILLILILLVILLWKKIQWIDENRVMHEDTNRKDKHKSEIVL